MSCPLCGGLAALKTVRAENHVMGVELFFLGVIIERAARLNNTHVSALVCVEHAKAMRAIADIIPLEVVGPAHRHLLNMGLSVVKGASE